MLVLRDLVTSKTHSIPASGAVIGREGGDADIAVLDAKVSKRHARVYAADGGWWIEDLQSANGTYIQKQRIGEPTEIAVGSTFRLAAHDFQVVEFTEDRQRSRADQYGSPTLNEVPAFPEPETEGAPRPLPVRPTLTATDEDSRESSMDAEDPDEMSPDATPLEMLGKAIAYQLATVPLLALNPIGTVRKSIDRQRFPPLEKLPLLGLAAPGLAILLAVGVVFQAIAALVMLINGGGFAAVTSLVIGVLVAVVGAAVGGLILAFAYHPVLKFILEKVFRGESTMKSRTNFLAISQSVGILSAVPNGIAALATLVAGLTAPHLPRLAGLIPIFPSIIQLACTLIGVVLTYRWFVYFKVHKIVPILVLIAGALAALGTGLGVVKGLRQAITGEGVASLAAPTSTAGGAESAAAHAEAPGATPVEAAKAAAATAAAAAAAAAATAKPDQRGPQPPVSKTPERLPERQAEKPEEPGIAKGATTPEPKTAPSSELPALAGETEPPPPPARLSPYQRYALKRDAVEHAITEDPLILRREPAVARVYRSYRMAVVKARRAELGKSGGDEVLLRHLIDASVYGTQARTIEELYAKLHLAGQPTP